LAPVDLARRIRRRASLRASRQTNNQEHPVGNNKNPDQKRPGEKEPGTFHFNPGNMSGKSGESDKKAKRDTGGPRGRNEQPDKKK